MTILQLPSPKGREHTWLWVMKAEASVLHTSEEKTGFSSFYGALTNVTQIKGHSLDFSAKVHLIPHLVTVLVTFKLL